MIVANRTRPGTGVVPILVCLLLVVGCAAPPSPSPAPSPEPSVLPPSVAPSAIHLTPEAVRDVLARHLDALAAIADGHVGTRAAGSAGDAATVDHIAEVLTSLGYAVTEDPFETAVYEDPGDGRLAIAAPAPRSFVAGRDFKTMIYSPAALADGPIAMLDWDAGARSADGPGCDASDFAGLAPGSIVVVRPGPCFRRTVVELAQAAGARAVVTAVPWGEPNEVRRHTLVDPAGLDIPSLVATGEVGAAMAKAAASGGRATIEAKGATPDRTIRSVFTELPGDDPGRVVMLGAHLDSSLDGPGINDDGSGVAALMAIAESLAGTRQAATIRFAFWAGEELGLKGSFHYTDQLPGAERARIVAYLNADMLGSPNGFRGVYDETGTAPGSDAIRDLFAADLDARGLTWEGVDLGGGSDHLPFKIAGVPTGGLTSGADELISPAQAERYGKQAGAIADACYHLACDDRSNVDLALLGELTSSLASVAVTLSER